MGGDLCRARRASILLCWRFEGEQHGPNPGNGSFTRVVDANSFTRAADTLAMPRASVTTIIQNLEALLGVRLMHTTRRLSLTPEGAAYYEHCMKIISEIAEADASFQTGNRKPSGVLRVHMPGSLGRRIVLPSLSIFRQRYRTSRSN